MLLLVDIYLCWISDQRGGCPRNCAIGRMSGIYVDMECPRLWGGDCPVGNALDPKVLGAVHKVRHN